MSQLTDTAGRPASNSPAANGKRFSGIIPPMLTPLRGRDELDVPGLQRLVEHILGGGVHGLFILGTTGEAPSLSYRLRRDLIDRVCRQVAGRVPVLVGITDTSFVESVHLARHAAKLGAAALVTSTPYYFPAGQPELLEFLQHFVPELPLPVFLYNMPAMTKVSFEIETLKRVADLEQIIGVKDSSGDMAYFRKVLELKAMRPDWIVLVGPEHLLTETLKMGGDGGINGGANVWPRLLTDLYQAAAGADPEKEATLQQTLLKFGAIYKVGQHASAVIKGLKCSASLLGICEDFMAEPFSRFRHPEREKVRAILKDVGLMS
jgi:2-dehydro-3-deoxy-D-pentonate aldolase